MLSTNNKTTCFISKAIKIHGDRYDYSNVNYINAKTKINIICKIHGEFEQTPSKHLSKYNFVKNEQKIQNIFICKNNEYNHLSFKK